MTIRAIALLLRAGALWFALEAAGLADASVAAQRGGDALAAVARTNEAVFSTCAAVALLAVAGGFALFTGRVRWPRR